MDYKDIRPGLILALKKDRREAYGIETTCAAYLVTGLKYKNGYKVPYVQCGSLFFKPSDFAKVVGSDFATLNIIKGNTVQYCGTDRDSTPRL
jgi:hypothetical protein